MSLIEEKKESEKIVVNQLTLSGQTDIEVVLCQSSSQTEYLVTFIKSIYSKIREITKNLPSALSISKDIDEDINRICILCKPSTVENLVETFSYYVKEGIVSSKLLRYVNIVDYSNYSKLSVKPTSKLGITLNGDICGNNYILLDFDIKNVTHVNVLEYVIGKPNATFSTGPLTKVYRVPKQLLVHDSCIFNLDNRNNSRLDTSAMIQGLILEHRHMKHRIHYVSLPEGITSMEVLNNTVYEPIFIEEYPVDSRQGYTEYHVRYSAVKNFLVNRWNKEPLLILAWDKDSVSKVKDMIDSDSVVVCHNVTALAELQSIKSMSQLLDLGLRVYERDTYTATNSVVDVPLKRDILRSNNILSSLLSDEINIYRIINTKDSRLDVSKGKYLLWREEIADVVQIHGKQAKVNSKRMINMMANPDNKISDFVREFFDSSYRLLIQNTATTLPRDVSMYYEFGGMTKPSDYETLDDVDHEIMDEKIVLDRGDVLIYDSDVDITIPDAIDREDLDHIDETMVGLDVMSEEKEITLEYIQKRRSLSTMTDFLHSGLSNMIHDVLFNLELHKIKSYEDFDLKIEDVAIAMVITSMVSAYTPYIFDFSKSDIASDYKTVKTTGSIITTGDRGLVMKAMNKYRDISDVHTYVNIWKDMLSEKVIVWIRKESRSKPIGSLDYTTSGIVDYCIKNHLQYEFIINSIEILNRLLFHVSKYYDLSSNFDKIVDKMMSLDRYTGILSSIDRLIPYMKPYMYKCIRTPSDYPLTQVSENFYVNKRINKSTTISDSYHSDSLKGAISSIHPGYAVENAKIDDKSCNMANFHHIDTIYCLLYNYTVDEDTVTISPRISITCSDSRFVPISFYYQGDIGSIDEVVILDTLS